MADQDPEPKDAVVQAAMVACTKVEGLPPMVVASKVWRDGQDELELIRRVGLPPADQIRGRPGRRFGSGKIRDKGDFDQRMRVFLTNWQGADPPTTTDATGELGWKDKHWFQRQLHHFGWEDWPTARAILSGGRYPK